MKNLNQYISESGKIHNPMNDISYTALDLTKSLTKYLDGVARKPRWVNADSRKEIRNAFAELDWEKIVEIIDDYRTNP